MPLEDWMAAIIDYRGKTPDKTSSGVPLITAKIVKGGRIEDPEEFIAEDAYEQWMRRGIPEAGDVVLTTEAPLGEVAQLDGRKVALAQRIITLRGQSGLLDNTYLKFALQSQPIQEQLHGRASGSTVTGIKQSELRKLQLTFPPVEEQRQVAAILGSLDDKIDLNRRINQILEAMAQAIFNSWFIDFDPVKAKIAAKDEGRDPLRAAMSAISGKPEAELDALPPEALKQLAATAALFPDGMEASELGEIPKGWFARTMLDCIEVNPSRTLKKGTVAKYLDMANVPTNSPRVQNIVPREFASGSKFRNGDTLLARITPCLENGKTAFVDFLSGDEVGWGSTEFIVLRPKNGFPEQFAYFLCRHPDFRAFAIAQMAGTSGRQRVPNDCFGGYKLVEPPKPIANEFGKLAGAVLDQIKALDEEAKTLASLRDTLLPKLLSGELPVEALAESTGAA